VPLAAEWRHAASTLSQGEVMGYAGDRKTILIVDDKWENRSVIVNLLEPIGFDVIEAENGKIGLEKAHAQKPDLIITDLVMPVMDGYKFMQQLRQSDELKATKVIVSSASVSQMDRQASLETGGDDFLAKPVHADELFPLLQQYLGLDWKCAPTHLPSEAVKISPNSSSDRIDEIAVPTTDVLQHMLQLAEQGRLKTLQTELQDLAQANGDYTPFAQQLQAWAKQFQAEKIEHFIQQHLA
ncbi:MAG: response regulator, partial [Cyanobacteria bacterium J06639_16]